VARGLLVLLHDLDLALVVRRDHRGVEVIGGLDLVVEGLDGLVVADGGVHAVVARGGDQERVGLVAHGGLSRSGWSAPTLDPPRHGSIARMG
jgi:hypothetical protein